MKRIELIARWFINKMNPTPLKLQKLLYFSQGFSFAFNDEELFSDDFEAWVHGPAIKTIYNEYKSYGYNPINIPYSIENLGNNTLKILEYVKENYGKYDDKYLEKITHRQTPWLYAREGLDPDARADKIIPKHIISDYFISFIHQPESEEWDK